MANTHQIELTVAGIKLLGGSKKRPTTRTILQCTPCRRAVKQVGKTHKQGVRLVKNTTKSVRKTVKRTSRDLKRSPVGQVVATLLNEKKRNKLIFKAKKTASRLYGGFVKTYGKAKKQYKRASKARIKKIAKYWRRRGGKYISKAGVVKLMKATKLKKLPRAKQIKRYVAKTVKKFR